MRVSVLVSDMSDNCLGRAYLLGKILRRKHEVEILGPIFGKAVWAPCDTGEFDYKIIRGRKHPGFLLTQRKLMRMITGDVVYSSKNRPTSFGTALKIRRQRGTPVILDIDDCEVDIKTVVDVQRGLRKQLRDPNSLFWTKRVQRLIPQADGITVVSRHLQERHGGVMVPHAKDTDHLDPARFDRAALRKAHGVANYELILYLGTPRPPTGLEELVRAMTALDRPDLRLMIVGAARWPSGRAWEYVKRLRALGGDRIIWFPQQPFGKMGEFLSIADLVVLPQRDEPLNHGQVPAKVFDAMAMALPVVATAMSDLPEILDGCGRIVPPGQIEALSEAIRDMLDDRQAAHQLGEAAREKCIRDYSWDVVGERLKAVVESVTASRRES